MNPENEMFQKWRESTGEEKEQYLQSLVKLLMYHARAVCWKVIPDLAQEFDSIANDSVWEAIRDSETFEGRSLFSSWFHKMVLNHCRNALKEKIRQKKEVALAEVG